MTATRWYLTRASAGSIWLHVDEREPPPGRSARGYMVSVTSRAQAREYLPHLRDALGRALAQLEAPTFVMFDPVESDERSDGR